MSFTAYFYGMKVGIGYLHVSIHYRHDDLIMILQTMIDQVKIRLWGCFPYALGAVE